jgi:hypothetical protein
MNARASFSMRLLRFWRHDRFRLILFAAALAALTVFHSAILGGCARLLVADQPLPESATHVLLGGGDRQFDLAAELLASGRCRRVLIQAGPPDRLAFLGILPTWTELCRREFGKRGVREEQLVVQAIKPQRSWDAVRALDGWLAEHPDARLIVLADRFRSGELAYVYRQILSDEHQGRLTVLALPDRRYDESNWWRSRTGIKAFFGTLLARGYMRVGGEESGPPYDPDPDAYERRVLKGSCHLSFVSCQWAVGGGRWWRVQFVPFSPNFVLLERDDFCSPLAGRLSWSAVA